ncbi:MAG: hypothetical protein Phog2KO_47910 [Phototrophicaceae bacterium]
MVTRTTRSKQPTRRILIRIATAVLQQVIIQITGQINRLEEEVIDQMKSLGAEVESGEVWKSTGANNFVRSINEECIPLCNDVIDSVSQINNNITVAASIIGQADNDATQVVVSLRDRYESI